jgi:uncharacterized metal-binding protein YceD (DUF177 family)
MTAMATTIRLVDISVDPMTRRVTIPASGLTAIAERLDLPEVSSLAGDLQIHRQTVDLIEISGRLEAQLKQVCVVTLEPFEAEIAEDFRQLFTTNPALAAAEIDDPMSDDSWPELLESDEIDLVDFVIQQLALSLDPHPRAPGAALEAESLASGDAGDASRPNPFASLPDLMKRDK